MENACPNFSFLLILKLGDVMQILILTITLTFVAPGKWNTVLNEFGDPSSSTM